MSLLQSLKKYNDETPIHGVGFIPRSKTLCEAGFWTCIVVIGVGMAINDLNNLIAFYNTEPMNVAIDIVKRSQLESPVPTICIDTYGISAKQNQFGRYGALAFVSNFNESIILGNALLLIDKMNSISDFDNISQVQGAWDILTANTDLSALTYAITGFLSSFEMLVSQYPSTQQSYNQVFFNLFELVNLGGLYEKTYRHLLDNLFLLYQASNVSFPDLFHVVGSWVCRNFYANAELGGTQGSLGMLRVAKNSSMKETGTKTLSMEICLPNLITHVSPSLICTKIENASLVTGGSYTLSISNFLSTPNGYRWHFDFQGRPFLPGDASRNVYHWAPSKWTTNPYGEVLYGTEVDVRLIQHISLFNRKTKPCMTPLSRFNGESEQRAKYLSDHCGCIPLLTNFSRSFSNNQSYCYKMITKITPDMDVLLAHIGSSNDENERQGYPFYRQSCASDALVKEDLQTQGDCEMVEFQVTERSATPSFSSNLNVYVYDEYLTSLTESPQKNWSTFISEFGGSIGVWLGASLIAFLHIPIYIFNVLYDYFKAKRSAKAVSNIKPVDIYSKDNNQRVSKLWHSAIYGDDIIARAHHPGNLDYK